MFFSTFALEMKKDEHKQDEMPQHIVSVPVAGTQSTVTDAQVVQKAILERLATLETKVSELSSDNSRKDRHIQSLQQQLHDVKLENKKLRQENKQLRQSSAADSNLSLAEYTSQ